MRKKILSILSLLILLSSLYAQNIRIIPSFLFDSGYNFSSNTKNKNINAHNFYTKLDGTLQLVVPKTYITTDYSINYHTKENVKFDINKLWGKFSLTDYISMQIGRYSINHSENLTYNVSDFINNNTSSSTKDGFDININLPFNTIPISFNVASLFFKDIKDMAFYFLTSISFYPLDLKLKVATYYKKEPSIGLSLHYTLNNFKISFDTAVLFNKAIKEKYNLTSLYTQFRFSPELSYYIPLSQNHNLNIKASYLFQSDGITKKEEETLAKNTLLPFNSYRQYFNTKLSYSYKTLLNTNASVNLNLENLSGTLITSLSVFLFHNITFTPSFTFLFGNDTSNIKNSIHDYMISFSVSKKI